jgi:hypothetical protein
MITRTGFDIDRNALIVECGFACPKCMEEIETTHLVTRMVSARFTWEKGRKKGNPSWDMIPLSQPWIN